MTMLGWLFGSPGGAKAVPKPVAGQHERRASPRYNLDRAVWIRRPRVVPAAGALCNISVTGAAVRVLDTGAWPITLSNGDEVWLSGLLSDPVACWVVAVRDRIMHVRFSLPDAMRRQLSAMIEGSIQSHGLSGDGRGRAGGVGGSSLFRDGVPGLADIAHRQRGDLWRYWSWSKSGDLSQYCLN
jgi:hypothetical protein